MSVVGYFENRYSKNQKALKELKSLIDEYNNKVYYLKFLIHNEPLTVPSIEYFNIELNKCLNKLDVLEYLVRALSRTIEVAQV